MYLMDLMNAKQTAKFLGITYSSFWRIMSATGAHPPYVMLGAKKRFIRSEVERWLIENQIPGRTTAAATANVGE
jgi:predicted DNA-binding transcriptional regulator AlpA